MAVVENVAMANSEMLWMKMKQMALRLWICSGLCWSSLSVFAEETRSSEDVSKVRMAYFLVIDHSGSMIRNPHNKHKAKNLDASRWGEMRRRLVSMIETVQPDSYVAIFSFSKDVRKVRSGVLATEEDRQAMIRAVEEYPRPDGETHLYDAMAVAARYLKMASVQFPLASRSVLIYTDGEDSGSRTSFDEVKTLYEQEGLGEGIQRFVIEIGPDSEKKSDLSEWGGKGNNKIAVGVQVVPKSLVLPHPLAESEPVFQLQLGAGVGPKLAELPVSATFRAKGDWGQAGAILSSSKWKIDGRPKDLSLRIHEAESLSADKSYEGELVLSYEEPDDYWIIGEPHTIPVRFPKADRPHLNELRPAANSVFIAGKPITFHVETLQNARVVWDFGNGDSKVGHTVSYVYHTPTDVTVTVSATSNTSVGPSKQSIPLKVIDLGVLLNPVPASVFEGQSLEISAQGRGPITRYEWLVNGTKFEGGHAQGKTALPYTFSRPGPMSIQVVGYSEKAVVYSDEVHLEVLPRPTVSIASPVEGESIELGKECRFRADVGEAIRDVRWEIRSGEQILVEKRSSVANGSTAWVHRFSDDDLSKSLKVFAAADVEVDGKKITCTAQPVSFSVELPAAGLTIVEPAEGTVLRPGNDASFAVSGRGGLGKVHWELRDGAQGRVLHQSEAEFDPVSARAELSYRLPLDVGEGQLTVSARSSLQVAPDVQISSDPVSFPVRYEAIQLNVSSPVENLQETFGRPVKFRADVQGPVGELQWTLRDAESGTVILNSGKRSFDHRFDARSGVSLQKIEVDCVVSYPGESAREPVKVSRTIELTHKGLEPKLIPPTDENGADKLLLGYRETFAVQLHVDGEVAKVEWDFGDGVKRESSELQQTHRFESYGEFVIQAKVLGKDSGLWEQAAPLKITVDNIPPVAVLQLLHGDKEVATVNKGGSVRIGDLSYGDIALRRLYVARNGETNLLLETDGPIATAYSCEDAGHLTFRLEVSSPETLRGVESAFTESSVRVRDLMATILAAVIGGLLMIPWTRYWRKNGPQHWYLHWKESDVAEKITRVAELEFSVGRRATKWWSRWKKEFSVPMGNLFAMDSRWRSDAFKGDHIVIRPMKDHKVLLRFSAEEDRSVTKTELKPGEVWGLRDKREKDNPKAYWFRVEKKRAKLAHELVWFLGLCMYVIIVTVIWLNS